MAFSREDTNGFHKRFWRSAELGNGMSEWTYVSDDAATTVEVTDYFLDAINELRVGDRIWLYQVGSLTDEDEVQDDMAAGITDLSLHVVVINDGSTIDVTPDLLGGTFTYTA